MCDFSVCNRGDFGGFCVGGVFFMVLGKGQGCGWCF